MSCGKPEDEDGEMPARRVQARSGKCVKCRENDIKFAKMAAGYCKECFVIVLSRRFKEVAYTAREYCRAQKGSTNRTNGSILLAYSGSASSRTTLDLLKSTYFSDEAANSRSQPAFSKLEVLYVRTADETDETVEQHRQTVAQYGLELSIASMEQVFEASQTSIDVSSSDLHISPCTESAIPLIKDNSFTATSQETLSSTILASFIAQYAQAQGHKAVIFCESATKLAAKTLTAISKGQGWNLGELVGGGDIPIAGSDVRIYRPLSVISDDEVRFFAKDVHNWPVADTLVGRSGIDGLVEGFVKNLEAGFPSTVSVISRTASKLGMRSTETGEEQTSCALCRLPRDPATRAWRPVASLSKFEDLDGAEDIIEVQESSADSFASLLCYGCLVPFMELQGPAKKPAMNLRESADSIRILPTYVQDIISQRKASNISPRGESANGRPDLRSQIESYLL